MGSERTEAAAMAIAERVARVLGEPWYPVVHENLGWHASVQFNGGYFGDNRGDGLTLYISKNVSRGRAVYSYSVMGINCTLGNGRTPLAAVRAAHKTLEERYRQAERLAVPLFSAIKRAARDRKLSARKRLAEAKP